MWAWLRRWVQITYLTIRYLFMNEDDRREMLAILRRQAWQARLLAAETSRLAANAKRSAEGDEQDKGAR